MGGSLRRDARGALEGCGEIRHLTDVSADRVLLHARGRKTANREEDDVMRRAVAILSLRDGTDWARGAERLGGPAISACGRDDPHEHWSTSGCVQGDWPGPHDGL